MSGRAPGVREGDAVTVDVCIKCASHRTSALETSPCPRGGRHHWQARQQPELAIDCMTCRLRRVVHGVAFVPNETHVGRVRRALLSQRERVLAFMQLHEGHEIATSPVDRDRSRSVRDESSNQQIAGLFLCRPRGTRRA